MVYSVVAYQRKGRVTGSVRLNPVVTAGEPSGPQGSDYLRNVVAWKSASTGIWGWDLAMAHQSPKSQDKSFTIKRS